MWVKKNNPEKRAQQKEVAWNEFVNTAGQRDFVRMDYMNQGIGYRVANPGAKIIDGMLYANVLYVWLIIHYTTNDEEPTVDSPEYKKPLEVNGLVKLKAFVRNGRSSRTVEAN